MQMAEEAQKELPRKPFVERSHPRPTHVHNLETALQAYWSATTSREDTAAYHQILLFGGVDGYPSYGMVRTTIARWLRKAALRIDGA